MLDKVGESRRLADYCLMNMLLKPGGYWGVIFGILAVFISLAHLGANPTNVIHLIIGLAMLIEGILIIKSPSPGMMLVEGSIFWMLAIWNTYHIYQVASAHQDVGRWPMIVLIQIISGGYFFKYYKRFVYLRDFHPSHQSIDNMIKQITSVIKGKSKREHDLIELSIVGFIETPWKGRLMEDAIMLVQTKRGDLIYAGKDQFNIMDDGKIKLSKSRKVTINAGDRKLKGKMAPEQLEKYHAWKKYVAEPRPLF
ncbi:MAG: hypothetical protein ABFD64_12885 [Armatimonadota bacterium]